MHATHCHVQQEKCQEAAQEVLQGWKLQNYLKDWNHWTFHKGANNLQPFKSRSKLHVIRLQSDKYIGPKYCPLKTINSTGWKIFLVHSLEAEVRQLHSLQIQGGQIHWHQHHSGIGWRITEPILRLLMLSVGIKVNSSLGTNPITLTSPLNTKFG